MNPDLKHISKKKKKKKSVRTHIFNLLLDEARVNRAKMSEGLYSQKGRWDKNPILRGLKL